MKELQILFCTGLTKSLATIFNFARNIFLLTDSCLTFLFNCSQIFVEIILNVVQGRFFKTCKI